MKIKTLLAMFGVLASTFTLIVKMMTPTNVQFIIEGNVIELNNIPSIYNTFDVFLIGASCFVLGVSLFYLLQVDRTRLRDLSESGNWDDLIENMTDQDERQILQLIANENGVIFQSLLVESSGFSKSKVSLVLDRLEARGVLERRRHGMSNVVVLK
jgi:ABC-type uncharacterized transport system permease subunit